MELKKDFCTPLHRSQACQRGCHPTLPASWTWRADEWKGKPWSPHVCVWASNAASRLQMQEQIATDVTQEKRHHSDLNLFPPAHATDKPQYRMLTAIQKHAWDPPDARARMACSIPYLDSFHQVSSIRGTTCLASRSFDMRQQKKKKETQGCMSHLHKTHPQKKLEKKTEMVPNNLTTSMLLLHSGMESAVIRNRGALPEWW